MLSKIYGGPGFVEFSVATYGASYKVEVSHNQVKYVSIKFCCQIQKITWNANKDLFLWVQLYFHSDFTHVLILYKQLSTPVAVDCKCRQSNNAIFVELSFQWNYNPLNLAYCYIVKVTLWVSTFWPDATFAFKASFNKSMSAYYSVHQWTLRPV